MDITFPPIIYWAVPCSQSHELYINPGQKTTQPWFITNNDGIRKQQLSKCAVTIPFLSQVIISIAKDFWPTFRVADNITHITPKYLCQSKTNTQQTISKLTAPPPPPPPPSANAKLQFLNRVPHDWFTSILFITCICAKVQYLLLTTGLANSRQKCHTYMCNLQSPHSCHFYSIISHWQGWTHNSLQDQQIYVYIKKSKIINSKNT